MKKITLLVAVLLITVNIINAQNVGIGNTNPLAKIDINGDIAFRSTDIAITSTYTYALNIDAVKQGNYKLKAANGLGNFILAGIISGVDGRVISLTNRTGYSMEIYNEDLTANATNRIQTGTGYTLAVYNNGSVTLQYDINEQRWLVKGAHNNSLDYFGGGASSSWDITGADISNTNAGNVGVGINTPTAKLTVNGNLALLSDTVKVNCDIMAPKMIIDNIAKAKSVFHIINDGCPYYMPPTIAGISGGTDGKILTLISHVNNLQIQHLQGVNFPASNADSLNMIELYEDNTNGTINQPFSYNLNNGGSITLIYDDTRKRWKPISLYGDIKTETLGWYKGNNLNDIYNPNPGNVGIGTGNPKRAKLVVAGDITSALFGNGGAGLSFQKDWPTIGFNQYRDVGTGWGKGISNGYGMHMYFNPSQGVFGIAMQDSVSKDSSFVATPRSSITILKNGAVNIGQSGFTDQATLSISAGDNFPSHFGVGSEGHTYIRGGNRRYQTVGVLNYRPSKVYINDVDGLNFFNGTHYPGGDVIMATGGGNVGIGIEDVPYKLSIYQPVIQSNSNTHVLQLRGQNPLMNFVDQYNTSRGYIKGITNNSQTQYPNVGIAVGASDLVDGSGNFGDIYLLSKGYQPALTVNGSTGYVGIGTNNPTYPLSVNGTIRAKEIVVEAANWPDYVFDEKYTIKPLHEIEAYIKANKHLPGILSAEEIKKDGLKVGEVQNKMMEKIEELTLYIIDLKKDIEVLKSKK